MLQVFGPLTFRGFPAFMKASETLQRQAKFEISKDVDTQLRRAMDAKQKVNLITLVRAGNKELAAL